MQTDTPTYWDNIAINEPVSKAGVPERYTQAQCLTAFRLGLKHLHKNRKTTILKTDLWTEGVVRSREVLDHASAIAEDLGYKVDTYGLDISPEICSRAIKFGTRATVNQGDIRNLCYPSNFFDLILDVSTIDHIPFSKATIALSEYSRCLVRGGILVLMFAHDSGRIERKGDHRIDYYPFVIADVKKELSVYSIKGEYAVHFLNFSPMNRPMTLGMKLGFAPVLAWLFGWLEFTPLSKLLRRYAPLYVIIGVKK